MSSIHFDEILCFVDFLHQATSINIVSEHPWRDEIHSNYRKPFNIDINSK